MDRMMTLVLCADPQVRIRLTFDVIDINEMRQFVKLITRFRVQSGIN